MNNKDNKRSIKSIFEKYREKYTLGENYTISKSMMWAALILAILACALKTIVLFIISVVVYVIGGIYGDVTVRCPHCDHSLLRVGGYRNNRIKLCEHCPGCGREVEEY